MTTAISTIMPAIQQKTDIDIWNDEKTLQEIRKTMPANLTDAEFGLLMRIGIRAGLNPFLREIWCLKYASNAAQIFIGRDGYRKNAQKHKHYDSHYAEAVYSNDDFSVQDGKVFHKFNMKDRGKLIGAYAIVRKTNTLNTFYVYIETNEYNTGRSVWKEKPATMSKKVAEAQALRMAFQEIFSGTYDESEQWSIDEKSQTETKIINNNVNNNANIDFLNNIKQQSQQQSQQSQQKEFINVIDRNDVFAHDIHEHAQLCTEQQLLIIDNLIQEKNFTAERVIKAMKHYNVNEIENLTLQQADDFIRILNKL